MSTVETASAEKSDSNANSTQLIQRKWLADVFVIVFCVSGAAFSLNLFRLDLFQSIATQNKKPMGAVTVKYNNVQRRFSDRVLWSRLTVKSPIYLGDLIRVAEYSSATLNINEGIVDINENSLIRIRASQDGDGGVVIDLGSGSLSITGSESADSGGSAGVALNVQGRIIAPTAGATMSASSGESGITLKVNEGSIIIKEQDGQSRSMSAGEALILDTKGVEQAAPAAVVTLPRPNARFIKNSIEPVNIRFTWNALNIEQKTPLRLEIASGPNFTRIVRTAEGVDSANVALAAGTWYWRLSYQNTVLSSGQFNIVEATITASTSPIKDGLFRYKDPPPSVRFEWQPVEEASYYILEAGLTPDIKNPSITRQTAVASYVEMSMEAGTWYWRVKPVFPSLYEGSPAYSQVSSFRIEKIEEPVIVAQPVTVAQSVETPAEVQEQSEPEPESKPEQKSTAIFANAEWAAYSKSSKSNISSAIEKIEGAEREVLTINVNLESGTQKWAGAATGTASFIQNLKNDDAVRFKILGDGRKWRIYFATSNVSDGGYHGLTITTKNGVVSNIDLPFNKLTQPDWARVVRFNKNYLKNVNIEINRDTSSPGASSIKVFDFETYPIVIESAKPVTPAEANAAALADSISNNPEFAIISQAAKWFPRKELSSKADCVISRETIEGIEREVLTINITLGSGFSDCAGALTNNIDVIQRLKNADGIRFKVLGDGRKWHVYLMISGITDNAYHRFTISTKDGVVSSFDIPYNKLSQPDNWGEKRKVRFNKNNITGLFFERRRDVDSPGVSTIKVFDLVTY
jgi:hypothetical protein